MSTHIHTATVYVSDPDTALDFYVNKLGFQKRRDDPMGPDLRWVEVAPPGAETGVVLVKGYGDWSPERVGTFTGLVLAVDDIQSTYEMWRDRGVPFSEPPAPQPWGKMQALFADQDGNGYVLVGDLPHTNSQPA